MCCVAETGAVAADAGGGLSAIGCSLGLGMKYGWLDLLSSIDQERRGLPHQRWIGTVAGLVSLPAGSLAARGLQWVNTCLSRQPMNFPAWQPVMLGRPAGFGQERSFVTNQRRSSAIYNLLEDTISYDIRETPTHTSGILRS